MQGPDLPRCRDEFHRSSVALLKRIGPLRRVHHPSAA
jgi:hypothetical protein